MALSAFNIQIKGKSYNNNNQKIYKQQQQQYFQYVVKSLSVDRQSSCKAFKHDTGRRLQAYAYLQNKI